VGKHKKHFYNSSQLTVTLTIVDNEVPTWMRLSRLQT